MPLHSYVTTVAIPIDVISGVSGSVDVGSAHGNTKTPFSIPDADLPAFFGPAGGGDGNIRIYLGNSGGNAGVMGNDGGLLLDIDSGTLVSDDGNWCGAQEPSITAEPMVVLAFTVIATGQRQTALIPAVEIF